MVKFSSKFLYGYITVDVIVRASERETLVVYHIQVFADIFYNKKDWYRPTLNNIPLYISIVILFYIIPLRYYYSRNTFIFPFEVYFHKGEFPSNTDSIKYFMLLR